MNLNQPNSKLRDLLSEDGVPDPQGPSEEELRALAQNIVDHCPSLTHLLLALGSNSEDNPLKNLN